VSRVAAAAAAAWALAILIGPGPAAAQQPTRIARGPAATVPRPVPPAAAIPPRNTGPEAVAHSRYRRGRHGTTRIIRRTPAVMREDAARVKRGDLFSTWSNEYLE
jgi:hypothetical protein